MRAKIGLAFIAVVALVAICALCGCGSETVETSPAAASVQEAPVADVTQTEGVILPEWAPEDPSPEFLRAAQVLKPLPASADADYSAGEIMKRRATARVAGPALFELFGSLTDEQLQEFLTSGEIRLSVKEMTPRQRTALDAYFDKYAEAHKEDDSPLGRDQLVTLYKWGAEEDLSNVDMGFRRGGHGVGVTFWIKRPDGHERYLSHAFAYM